MFPGLGGMNPAQMQRMMKQLGIKTESFEARTVVVELSDGRRLRFDKPQLMAMVMQGQKTFTIVGEPIEEHSAPAFSEEDLAMIVAQTSATKEQALDALSKTKGDIAEAILLLQKE